MLTTSQTSLCLKLTIRAGSDNLKTITPLHVTQTLGYEVFPEMDFAVESSKGSKGFQRLFLRITVAAGLVGGGNNAAIAGLDTIKRDVTHLQQLPIILFKRAIQVEVNHHVRAKLPHQDRRSCRISGLNSAIQISQRCRCRHKQRISVGKTHHAPGCVARIGGAWML